MYEYKVKRKNKAAAITIAFSFAVSAICLFGGRFSGSFRSVTEIVGLLAFFFAILIMGRYLLREYIYSVEKTENGEVDLTVVEVQGKRRTTVCRIGLSEIKEILFEDPVSRGAVRKRLKPMKRYDYCIDLSPSRSIHLLFSDGDRAVAVRLEPDERMKALIVQLSSAGRTEYVPPTDDEA